MGTSTNESSSSPAPSSSRLRRGAAGHAKFVYWTLLGAVVLALFGFGYRAMFKSDTPTMTEQVRAIERKERETRKGSLQNVETNLTLHGDGTRSWVFEFAEPRTWRLVIYDAEQGRLRKAIEVTNRIRLRPKPMNYTYQGVSYRRLSQSKKRSAQVAWLRLYNPQVILEKPSTLLVDDGSRVLLVPVTAFTGPQVDLNTFRSTLVAVFWSANDNQYVVHGLYALNERWTIPGPKPLQLELRPGAGFRSLPTSTDLRIDVVARLVFAIVGGGPATLGARPVQVHAFRLPLSADDLEECPALWPGAAPIGKQADISKLERGLSEGCPHT
jgi:hypothetical protein